MIINSLNKLLLCQKWVVQFLDAGDTIMWKKDMIPTLLTAHSVITKRKTKKQYSVVSTKMEICMWENMVCLFAQGETSKAFQEEI